MTIADDGGIGLQGLQRSGLLIDPRASDSVILSGGCKHSPVEEATTSKAGCAYVVAGGDMVVNEGQRDITSFS